MNLKNFYSVLMLTNQVSYATQYIEKSNINWIAILAEC